MCVDCSHCFPFVFLVLRCVLEVIPSFVVFLQSPSYANSSPRFEVLLPVFFQCWSARNESFCPVWITESFSFSFSHRWQFFWVSHLGWHLGCFRIWKTLPQALVLSFHWENGLSFQLVLRYFWFMFFFSLSTLNTLSLFCIFSILVMVDCGSFFSGLTYFELYINFLYLYDFS